MNIITTFYWLVIDVRITTDIIYCGKHELISHLHTKGVLKVSSIGLEMQKLTEIQMQNLHSYSLVSVIYGSKNFGSKIYK